jgi:hypothetical protein
LEWTVPEPVDGGAVKLPQNWLHSHYYEALTVLFRVENALRTFVFVVLKDAEKSAWRNLAIKTEDGSESTIAAIARRRLAQDATFGYLGYPISSPLMHLTSGELIRIILADAYWPRFSTFFPAAKGIVQTKLEEIGNVRNALAHFRPLQPDDVEVVKQNANQVMSGIETLLISIVDCPDTVPTNLTDGWYKELKPLSGPYIHCAFKQSVDGQWIRIELTYGCPIIGQPISWGNYRSYRILSVNTPKLLTSAPGLLDNVVFASEGLPWLGMPDSSPPSFSKDVRFLFSRETLNQHHAEVKQGLNRVIAAITEESDLIKEDNLARGELIQATDVTATRESADKSWQFDSSNLKSTTHHDDPPEFWAGYPFMGQHFVSNSESFPWMPVDVSKITFPF